MPIAPTIPAHADAPLRLLAHPAATRVQIPAALHALLLVVLAHLLARPHLLVRLAALSPWHPTPGTTPGTTTPGSAYDTGNLRVDRYWRALVDWLLNGRRNHGMAHCGAAFAPPCPARTARAPPRRVLAVPNPFEPIPTPKRGCPRMP